MQESSHPLQRQFPRYISKHLIYPDEIAYGNLCDVNVPTGSLAPKDKIRGKTPGPT